MIHRETKPREWNVIHAARNLHESSINGISFSPHEYGLLAAAASSDGRVSVLEHEPNNSWNVQYLSSNNLGVNAVSWAPHGAYYDSDQPDRVESPRLVTAGCDNKIRFWVRDDGGAWTQDTATTDDAALQHTDWVRDVAWAPSLLPNENMVASCSEDRTVLIWKQKGVGTEWSPTLLHRFDAPVWRVSWSVTGHLLAVSSGDSDVTLWKAGLDGTWTQMSSVEDGAAAPVQG